MYVFAVLPVQFYSRNINKDTVADLGFETTGLQTFVYNALLVKILDFTYRYFVIFSIAYFQNCIAICDMLIRTLCTEKPQMVCVKNNKN